MMRRQDYERRPVSQKPVRCDATLLDAIGVNVAIVHADDGSFPAILMETPASPFPFHSAFGSKEDFDDFITDCINCRNTLWPGK